MSMREEDDAEDEAGDAALVEDDPGDVEVTMAADEQARRG